MGTERVARGLVLAQDAVPCLGCKESEPAPGELLAGMHRRSAVGLEMLAEWAAAGVSYQKPLGSSSD